MIKQEFETPLSRAWRDEENIFWYVIKKNACVTKADLAMTFQYYRDNASGKKICMLADITKALFPLPEAREHAASEGELLIKAVAILVDSEISRLIANTFMMLQKPVFPVRTFSDVNHAKEWLRQYMGVTLPLTIILRHPRYGHLPPKKNSP